MIEFYDQDAGVWKTSRFGWTSEDVAWLNATVGWEMYRQTGASA